jgi:hypothetical protein
VSATTFAENLFASTPYYRLESRERRSSRTAREVRAYMVDFLADILACASMMPHEKRAFFISNLFLTLFKPAMSVSILFDAAAGEIPGLAARSPAWRNHRPRGRGRPGRSWRWAGAARQKR